MMQCTNCGAVSTDADFVVLKRVDKENLCTPLQKTDKVQCFMCGADESYIVDYDSIVFDCHDCFYVADVSEFHNDETGENKCPKCKSANVKEFSEY